MMTFSTRVFVLTLMLGLVFILAACASESPAAVPPIEAPAPTSEPVAPTEASATTEAVDAAPAEDESTEPTDEPAAPEPAVAGVSFQSDVLPILERSCVRCHGGMRREEGLDLRTYDGMMAGSVNGLVIVPGDASGSQLIGLVVEGEMPSRGPGLSDEQIQVLIDWVNQGALGN
jgi:hypothetical protein